MKKTEREHLKQDPLQHFLGNAYETVKKFRKEIFIGIAVIAAIGIIFAGVMVYQTVTAKAENRIFSDAIKIKNDANLTPDQKIEKLSKLDSKSGVSASINLYIANLYFEKGDVAKAKEYLEKFSSSRIDIINNQKTILEADIMAASNNTKEAIDLLNKLLTESKNEVPKDFILIKMAKLQIKSNQKDAAKANLNRIIDEFDRSAYTEDARQLLSQIEN